jgi:hypothetical protein
MKSIIRDESIFTDLRAVLPCNTTALISSTRTALVALVTMLLWSQGTREEIKEERRGVKRTLGSTVLKQLAARSSSSSSSSNTTAAAR